MPTYRITEQEANVIERSYDVEAPNEEAAQDIFEAMTEAQDKTSLLVHSEVVRKNVEIIGVEVVT